MKKKEIQAKLKEKINQLINELREIPNDVVRGESCWIKDALKGNLVLEECLIVSIKDLVSTALDNINNT